MNRSDSVEEGRTLGTRMSQAQMGIRCFLGSLPSSPETEEACAALHEMACCTQHELNNHMRHKNEGISSVQDQVHGQVDLNRAANLSHDHAFHAGAPISFLTVYAQPGTIAPIVLELKVE
eukprot:1161644-Pelagomonas_calceolata.AAC.2